LRLFTMGSFLKITKVGHIFVPLFKSIPRLCSYSDKKGLGYILGAFFTNSCGHPGFDPRAVRIPILLVEDLLLS
jgi:hypothetical protein